MIIIIKKIKSKFTLATYCLVADAEILKFGVTFTMSHVMSGNADLYGCCQKEVVHNYKENIKIVIFLFL